MKTYLAQFGQLPSAVRRGVLRRTLAIFAAASAITAVATWDAYQAGREAARLRFDGISDKVVNAISENMEAYEQVLRGGVALFDTFGNVSRKQWAAYVNALKLSQQYPGIQGVGFAAVITRDEIGSVERTAHLEGLPDFKVRTQGQHDLLTTILYLDPMDWRNRRALGFDMYSEKVRRKAMRQAWHTGRPALSGGVTLLQETSKDVQRGVLLYLPVYTQETDPKQPEIARQVLKGFVYSPFRMNDLLSHVLARTDSYSPNIVRVEVFDGPTPEPASLLYDSAAPPAPATERDHWDYQQGRTLAVHGTTWAVRLSSLPEFERQMADDQPMMTALIGLLLGALAAALFGFVNIGKETAHFTAQQLSTEIETRKRAEQQTRVALRELAHRVKNTLTIVTAMATQTVRHSNSLSEFDSKFRSRLLGLSRVHDLLTSGRSYETDLAVLAKEVLKPYQGDNAASLVLEGPPVVLAPNTAIMLSMLFNELATNATKYGAWSVAKGSVQLVWQVEKEAPDKERTLAFYWRERGGPEVRAPDHQGFGSNVIKFSVERSLRGRAHVNYAPEGVTYEITIPWPETDDATDEG